MIKVEISKRRWLRGTVQSGLNMNGKQCCLGFMCRDVGFKAHEIRRCGMPADLDVGADEAVTKVKKAVAESELFGKLVGETKNAFGQVALVNTRLSEEAARINDDSSISDIERQKRLKKLFRAEGIQLKFVD